MKKQLKKLSLAKRTLTNLDAAHMNKPVGGNRTNGNCGTHQGCSGNCTENWCSFQCTDATCHGHTCGGNCGLTA